MGREEIDIELGDIPQNCSCGEVRVELVVTTLPTVRFPWEVATEPLGKTHSIETGRDIPGIVFTSQVKVKSLL